ncbi:hypothetical protein [Brevibacterium sp. SMBL_HHYL_HB1]|uniref:hypothetical protein n=1 Tax=Brevibacterium sp. SMBL_HHYL_HB1 TaxID=2777556 RepID=UPI001BABC367|nr:hypothetical protein [Brevibacterium sp. SMBL_HHYL_HB1]QUL78057.1 hypothetical protein IG171_11250 [Brevibacterium sp. SMBL_HHYL_HB1]
MVSEKEFAEAVRDFHLAVNAVRQAKVEVDEARLALEQMQCLKEFQLVVPDAEGVDYAFLLTLCGLQKGHEGPHGEEPMTPEYEEAVILGESQTIRKDTGWLRGMDRQSRLIRANGGRPWM